MCTAGGIKRHLLHSRGAARNAALATGCQVQGTLDAGLPAAQNVCASSVRARPCGPVSIRPASFQPMRIRRRCWTGSVLSNAHPASGRSAAAVPSDSCMGDDAVVGPGQARRPGTRWRKASASATSVRRIDSAPARSAMLRTTLAATSALAAPAGARDSSAGVTGCTSTCGRAQTSALTSGTGPGSAPLPQFLQQRHRR
jgi:hypothetical protein